MTTPLTITEAASVWSRLLDEGLRVDTSRLPYDPDKGLYLYGFKVLYPLGVSMPRKNLDRVLDIAMDYDLTYELRTGEYKGEVRPVVRLS